MSLPESAPSVQPDAGLNPGDCRTLVQIANASIAHGLSQGRALPVEAVRFTPALRAPGACFVTLHLGEQLRGCIGSLEAHRPLVVDAAQNAYAAAFGDPRFRPLRVDELVPLSVHLSVLSAPVPMAFTSQDDLLSQLRPGVDGLILMDMGRRGTFLPAVWEQLPDPTQFLAHLKTKAGLPVDHWSPTVRVWRYTAQSIP